jgi:hypothetical protein
MKKNYSNMLNLIASICIGMVATACSKGDSKPTPPTIPVVQLVSTNVLLNEVDYSSTAYGVNVKPVFKLYFNTKVDKATIANATSISSSNGEVASCNYTLTNGDSCLVVSTANALQYLSKYNFQLNNTIKSSTGGALTSNIARDFYTQIDSTRKFPTLTKDELLDKVQKQTLKYFWDFGHPVSGLARERNTTPETVTSGGSGFGIMAIVAGVDRGFVSRADGLTRMQTIVTFLKDKAQTFHGAYPHWLNGTTGLAIAFSPKDDGADLVETSYLMQGLISAREYFSKADATETKLRNDINSIYNRVEWSWFTKNNENILYWHWSPNYNWDMNMGIKGWNECLITYVMAASSSTYGINASVYKNGWTSGSNFINGNSYYGYKLPLGEAKGGPLFFSHYSFLGINPNNLSDAFANYTTQTVNHSLINYNYCKSLKGDPAGYSDSVWGLTASDIPNGYSASSPTNDRGVIAPTAALSSFPYTPNESMAALQYYYYVLGDKVWKEYGFIDAFKLQDPWFASSFLAIDQGPIIVMIENYRSGLFWNLFMNAPEVQTGLKKLGFSSPMLK